MQPFLEITLTNIAMATVLAFVAAAATRIFRRPVLSHFLWLLVLLKLITPPLIPVRLSLPPALEAALVEPAATKAPAQARTSRSEPAPEVVDPLEVLGQSWDDLNEGTFVLPELLETDPNRPVTDHGNSQLTPSLPAAAWNANGAMTWTCLIWLGGSVLWVVMAVARMVSFHSILRHARPAGAHLQAQACLLAERMGLARCPELCIVPGRVSPLLWAVGRKVRLVLPSELLGRLELDQQITLLAHELAHARRRDHWVRWLEFVVIAFYWWLPVAWWARRQVQEAEEQCCDAWVVWMLPAAARAYAKALLQTVVFLDARPGLPPAASGVGHLFILKRRLKMIVHERLCPRLPWPVHVGTVLLGMLILPLAPQRLAAQLPKEETSSVAAASFDEDDPPARGSQEAQLRQLEQRMNRLEDRLDRVLRSLEGRTGARNQEVPRNRDMSREDNERATAEKRRAEDRERAMAERKKALDADREKMKEVMKERTEKLKKALAERRASEETMRAQRARDPNATAEMKKLDPERMKVLEKQIQDLVNQTINPERMKELEKQIQGLVEKNLNPERMKQMDKQIQDMIHKTINPERMERLQKQIEEIVAKSLAAEQRQRSRPERPRTAETPDRPRTAETPDRPARPATPRGAGSGRGTGQGDLERRLDKLEEKMDRLLQALESKQKSGESKR